MSLSILINILLASSATTVTALGPRVPPPDIYTPGAPGFADCPPGILCPIIHRRHQQPRHHIAEDEDCDEEPQVHAAALPLDQPPVETIQTITSCPPDVPDCPGATPAPTSTVIVCPDEGCDDALPVAPARPALCPVEECPECSPDACIWCPPGDDECYDDMYNDNLPPCPEYCPPPAVPTTPAGTTPTPNPVTPSSNVPVPPPEHTDVGPQPPPVAAAERRVPHAAPGVYLGTAAVFVAINWF
ncbi:hypothetical protein ACRE_035520 [Hapsidospora chrysogenum ATCC 11550]|uniref:Uncharacterized protein n=1 Tax=Hapsidospora chrysogenum (strain ATCC 11550 / CBS 779.69 / DSM 880 / IAM 14645 / JCM 23072 / IMI 49137) TaxID=857340 RepID=A0A086T8E8_HAPC1|nr:hypothetical protein ACRE_035520 [Hapsidospora chrysogenum ATCC 11550]